jgi:hypothetical protein
MGVGFGPFPRLQRRLDGVATEPEVVVTAGTLGEQSLACGERGFACRALRLDQPKDTIKNRPHVTGTRLFRRRQALVHERKSLATVALSESNLSALAEGGRLKAARVESARLRERLS